MPTMQLACVRTTGPAIRRAPVWVAPSMGAVQARAMPPWTSDVLLLRVTLLSACIVLAACACQKHWSYTTRNTSEIYAFNGTCANPGGDRTAAWCPVDAGTCAHQPRQGRILSKGPYNLCNAERDTTTLDTRARSAHLGTAMAIALYPQMKSY